MHTVRRHAEGLQDQFPEAKKIIDKHTIVDDHLFSVDTPEQAIKIKDDLVNIYQSAGMNIRKWVSNSPELINTVPEADRGKGTGVDITDLEVENRIGGTPMPTTTALGQCWQTSTDQLMFKVAEPDANTKWTKRKLASLSASIFDPLGLISPFLIIAKGILHAAWLEKIDWDEELTPALNKSLKNWLKSLPDLEYTRIPRCTRKKGLRTGRIACLCRRIKQGHRCCHLCRVDPQTNGRKNCPHDMFEGQSRDERNCQDHT